MKYIGYQRAVGEGECLRITEPILRECPGGMEYLFSVWMDRGAAKPLLLNTISFTADVEIDLRDGIGTPALMAALVPAMRVGLPLVVEAPVSPRLLANLDEYQDIFSTWFEPLEKIDVRAPLAEVQAFRPGRKTGSWFSLGVDGFDTFLRRQDEIDELAFIHGFDVDVEKHGHRTAVQSAVEQAALELGKPLTTIQTNVRCFTDQYVWWGHALGGVLGAAGQLLSGHLDQMFWASSADYGNLPLFGTSPITDPYLRSDAMRVIHEGAAFNRMEKVEEIAGSELALRHLRVCWGQEGTAQNCGACDKCLRTMTALEFLGLRDKAPTFPAELDLEKVRAQNLLPVHAIYLRDFREIARKNGREDSELMQAWEAAMRGVAADVDDPEALSNLDKEAREQLRADLAEHAPVALRDAIVAQSPRIWREVVAELFKQHPGKTLKMLFGGKD